MYRRVWDHVIVQVLTLSNLLNVRFKMTYIFVCVCVCVCVKYIVYYISLNFCNLCSISASDNVFKCITVFQCYIVF